MIRERILICICLIFILIFSAGCGKSVAKVGGRAAVSVVKTGGRVVTSAGSKIIKSGGKLAVSAGKKVIKTGGKLAVSAGSAVIKNGGELAVSAGKKIANVATKKTAKFSAGAVGVTATAKSENIIGDIIDASDSVYTITDFFSDDKDDD